MPTSSAARPSSGRCAILREAMVAQGFEVYPEEWWHFDYKDWRRYGIGTKTFSELASAK
jgi:D-alanyl-D-alanine dipeptidase